MRIFVADQYFEFKCAASACPFTCCGGYWQILIDKETDLFYQSLEGEFGAFLNAHISRNGQESKMILDQNGNCTMLTEEKLCSIQLNYGHDRLCRVCQSFPRASHRYGNILFQYMMLSCPEVGREFFSQPDFQIIDSEAAVPGEEKELVFDTVEEKECHDIAIQALSLSLSILQDRTCDIIQRQRLFLLLNRAVQTSLGAKNFSEARNILTLFSKPETYRNMAVGGSHTPELASKVEFIRKSAEWFIKCQNTPDFYSLFSKTSNYMQLLTVTKDYPQISEYFRLLNQEPYQREQEVVLITILLQHYLRDDAPLNLFNASMFIIIFNQLQRIFTAILSARDGSFLTANDRILNLSYLSRYFDHVTNHFVQTFIGHLEYNRLNELNYLFRLIT